MNKGIIKICVFVHYVNCHCPVIKGQWLIFVLENKTNEKNKKQKQEDIPQLS